MISSLFLNLSIAGLFVDRYSGHSPLLPIGASNHRLLLVNSKFSYFSTFLIISSNSHIETVAFNHFVSSAIRVASYLTEETYYSSPLIIDTTKSENQKVIIKRCYFNRTTNTHSGNGAIDFTTATSSSVEISDCTFNQCTSENKNGVFELDFESESKCNITKSCFFKCSSKDSTKSKIFSTSKSELYFSQNLIVGCDDESNSYLISSRSSKKIQSIIENNFTQNSGSLISLSKLEQSSDLSELTFVNHTSNSITHFLSLSNMVLITDSNFVDNNLPKSALFSSDNDDVTVDNCYFSRNTILEFVPIHEISFFIFESCVLDFDPKFDIDDSNKIVVGAKITTVSVDENYINENLCLLLTPKITATNSGKGSSWLTVVVFMLCGISVIGAVLFGLYIYLRKSRRGLGKMKFLAIAEVSSGYDKVYDVV